MGVLTLKCAKARAVFIGMKCTVGFRVPPMVIDL